MLQSIRHLDIAGSSGWVICWNITRPCNIHHTNRNVLELPGGSLNYITITDVGLQIYRPFNWFQRLSANSSPVRSCLSAAPSAGEAEVLDSWAKLRCVVDRVHRHVCVHATYSNMRTFLCRSRLWNENVHQYLSTTISHWINCKASSTPLPNHRISLSSLHRPFNKIVCLDHFYLEYVTSFHEMDVPIRFSAAHVVSSTNIAEAIYAFELIWVSQFWPREFIDADGAF